MLKKLMTFSAATLAAMVAIAGVLFATRTLQVIVWELPENYHGWVVVGFEDPQCGDSQRNLVYSEPRIPSSGLGCASFPYPRNWTINRSRYVRSDGKIVGISSRK